MFLKKIGMSLVVLATASQVFAKEGVSMKGSVSKSIVFNKEDKVIKPLFNESFKVMGIGLSKGQKLEKHQTPTAAFLYVESGQVNFVMNGETTVLATGDYFSIPPKEMHEVVAQEDSRLMLIK
ncbi:MAG: cupin domain-containing protein [Oligoflexia bacterium]|nr:cupin domain-containing protein [Oligoflexia bacterium]